MDFSTRAHTPELMDGPCSYQEFQACLIDLGKVNRLTLAYRPTLQWLDRIGGSETLNIVDVGSGYGDMLRRIAGWARRRGRPVRLTGVDLNPFSTQAAARATSDRSITWATSNAFNLGRKDGVDVVISALFTHHLTDAEIVTFIRWMEETADRGWFINDLHRHRLPYVVFRFWAWLAGWHRFVRHDGPVSITRSFVAADWRRLCGAAGLDPADVTIRWRFPFRLCVGRMKR